MKFCKVIWGKSLRFVGLNSFWFWFCFYTFEYFLMQLSLVNLSHQSIDFTFDIPHFRHSVVALLTLSSCNSI